MQLPPQPQDEKLMPAADPIPAPEAEETTIAATAQTVSDEPLDCEEGAAADDASAPTDGSDWIAVLNTLLETSPADISTEDMARAKQLYHAAHSAALREAREAYEADGGDPEAFEPTAELMQQEELFKNLFGQLREKKAEYRAQLEKQWAENLAAKKEIIAKIVELGADADNVNRHYQEAKELQGKFKEIGEVPPQDSADTWKAYQDAVERFYDQFKINMELRDYDFKKNLAEKQLLIAEADRLVAETDPVASFRRLQALHDKWRLTGPVAKDLREELWMKFKDASAVINKRYQEYFEARKAAELEAENAKTQLCEEVEALDFSALDTNHGWDEMTKQVLDMQERWKQLGFAPRKVNQRLFNRFREGCDAFFQAKAAFFKNKKEQLAENLARKTALAERAEALKESTDWRAVSDELVKLQKEWKEIGPVAKKHSDAIWRRFKEACDAFFDKKKEATSGQRAAEQANLKAKKAIIEALKAINVDEMPREEAIARFREAQAEWATIGHVPFRDKDKIYDEYRALGNSLYEKLDLRGTNRRMAAFTEGVEKMSADDRQLARERERLARIADTRRQELNTYLNNMGFLSSKSKSGEKMVKELERKIERIREDIADLEKKIAILDQKLS